MKGNRYFWFSGEKKGCSVIAKEYFIGWNASVLVQVFEEKYHTYMLQI